MHYVEAMQRGLSVLKLSPAYQLSLENLQVMDEWSTVRQCLDPRLP
jgi:hypothetical protein